MNIEAISGISQYLTYSSNNLNMQRTDIPKYIHTYKQCTLIYVLLHKLTC